MGFAKYVTLAILVCGCDGGKSAPAKVSPPVAVPGDAALVADASIDAPAGPRLDELAKVDAVPALDLKRPSGAKLTKSKQLNIDGFKLHAKKDYTAAAAKYQAALVEDPGNVLARYNLASVAVLAGDVPRGLAILATFMQPDCRACVGILRHAMTDPEWATARATAAFVEITRDAKADMPAIEPIARQLASLIQGEGKTEGLAPYFHPRQPFQLTVSGREFARVWSPAELKAWGRNADELKEPYVRVPSVFTCKDTCCDIAWDPEACKSGCGSDTAYDLQRICLGGVGDVWFVEKAEFYSFMSSMP